MKFKTGAILSALAALAASAALSFSAQAGDFKACVLYWSMNIPGQVAMREGLESEIKAINAAAEKSGKPKMTLETRVAGDGDAGIERQIEQMREAVAMKPDVIIVQPADNAALAGPLREANEAGIPVVAYDQYIDGGKLAAYRTSDNYQAGWLDGEYIAARFPEERMLRLLLVEYPHVSSTVERLNGFLDALTAAGRRFKVLKSYKAVEPVGGKAAGEAILRDFPERGGADVVFTVNDGAGLAVVETLAKAGRDEMAVASVDGDPASVENIRAGRLTVIDSAQFCGPLGAEAARAAYALLSGESVPAQALVPVFPVAKETLSMYPGWQGPVPADFKKPWKCGIPEWSGKLKAVKR